MNHSLDIIIKRLGNTEDQLTYLINKIHFFQNEIEALHKRIALIEKENDLLKTKRDVTVGKLKDIMQKIDNVDL